MIRVIQIAAKHCLTGIDGETYDVGRILLSIGAFSMIGYTGLNLYINHQFDPIGFGAGLGGLIGGAGIGIGAKAKTEPDPPPGSQRMPEDR